MLAISVPMLIAFAAALIIVQFLLRGVVAKFPDTPAARGLAAIIL